MRSPLRRQASRFRFAVSVFVVLMFVTMTGVPVSLVGATSPTSNTFVVQGAIWGTSSTPLEVGPGSLNVPLVVSLEFLGSSQASRVQATLGLPTGITDVYGNSEPSASTVSVSSNAVIQLTYNLNIAQNFAVGIYSLPIGIEWNYTSTSLPGFYFESHTVNMRILGTVQLSASASQTSLNAGEVNNVTLTLTNRGTGVASQITPTVSTSLGSVLTILPIIPDLSGGSSVPLAVRVYVPSSNAGQATTLTLSTSYTDAYGSSASSSLSMGFYTVTVPEPVLTFSAAAGASLTPGEVNEVVVTLTNEGPGAASAIKTSVGAPSGFSVLNNFPQVVNLQVGQSVNTTLRVFAPASVITSSSVSSAAGSAATLTFSVDFTDPYGYSQSTSQTLGLYITSSVAISSATSLSVSTTTNSLAEGQTSPVAFVIKNTGQQPVYAPTISLSISSPLVVSVNSTITLAGATINPGSSLTYAAAVTTGTSATGGSYGGDLTITYTDQLGDSHTATVPVAFVVTLPVLQVSVSSLASQVGVGKTSTVAFMIINSGTAQIYSPTFTLVAPSGLAVTTNATFSRSGLIINPGKSVKYVANVTSGPKTTEGPYIATLTVSYADQFGNAHSSSFSMGLVVVGGIQMVVQNEVASFSGTTLSVSGTLLNEGLANAYYTQVTATLASGKTRLGTSTSYIGEVDSNTPIPIALSVSVSASALASANSTATLTLTSNYQNDYGQALQSTTTQPVSLSAGRSAGRSSTAAPSADVVSAQALDIIRYAGLLVIVAAAIVTVAYVRRGRSKGKRGGAQKSDVY